MLRFPFMQHATNVTAVTAGNLFSLDNIRQYYTWFFNKYIPLKQTWRWTSTPYRRHGCLRQLYGLLWPWPLTFDLQNLIRSSVGANEHSLWVSSRLLRPFMRYHDNKVSPDERTDERTNAPDWQYNIMPSPTVSSGEGIKQDLKGKQDDDWQIATLIMCKVVHFCDVTARWNKIIWGPAVSVYARSPKEVFFFK